MGSDLAEWLERLTADAKVATVLGSIPASSDTLESEGRQMKQCWIKYLYKKVEYSVSISKLWAKNNFSIAYVMLTLLLTPYTEWSMISF